MADVRESQRDKASKLILCRLPLFCWPFLVACFQGGVQSSQVPRDEAIDGHSGCQLRCEADLHCEKSVFVEDSNRCEVTFKSTKPPRTPPKKDESRFGGKMHKVLLVSYADGERFEKTQRLLDESLDIAEIEEHWAWNTSTFEEPEHAAWMRRNSHANFPRGGAWKPYVIWQAFRRVEWDDWLVYHDSSQYIQEGLKVSIQPLLGWLEQQRSWQPCQCIPAIRLRQSFQHEWESHCTPAYSTRPRDFTKAFDIFCGALVRTGTCGLADPAQCCHEMWDANTHQHSWSVWRKNMYSARFLHEWMMHSQDAEAISRLPLVDQSMNALLVYKWRADLQLKTLWVPSIYEQQWAQDLDLGPSGRIGAELYKHINLLLDTMWNSAAMQQHLVWLIDPAKPVSELVKEGMGSRELVFWGKSMAASKQSWERSLCVHRKAVDTQIISADVRRVWKLDEKAIPLTRRFKHPSAWPTMELQRLSFPEDGPDIRRPPIPYVGILGEPHFEDCRRAAPWREPGADCFHLASLQVGEPVLDGTKKKKIAPPRGAVLLWAGVVILNEGFETWPEGATLCLAGGNSSKYLLWESFCQSQGGRVKGVCPRVESRELVQMELELSLFAPGLWDELRSSQKNRVSFDVMWTMCLPSKAAAEPSMVAFGTLIRLRFVVEKLDDEFVASKVEKVKR